MEITKVSKRNNLEFITVCEVEHDGNVWECEIEYDADSDMIVSCAFPLQAEREFNDQDEQLLLPLVYEYNEMELRQYRG